MGFFSFFGRRQSSLPQAVLEHPKNHFVRMGGRLINTESAYALPADFPESERLNLQHYVMRYALQGNYAIPFQQMEYTPEDILDVACGTGRWGAEMALEFPRANVVGIDITTPNSNSPSVTLGRGAPPDNYLIVQGDIRNGLPFPNDSFNYVHMRFLVVAIAANDWPSIIQELVRVTRSGGWIELVDTVMSDPVGSPAHQTFFQWFDKMMASRGYDLLAGEHIEGYLKEAGLKNIQSHQVDIPIGDWGGRLGTLMRLDIESAAAGIVAPVTKYGIATESEAQAVVKEMSIALKTYSSITQPFYIAYGQKQ
jgi:ubiquinone/menaquinone biosynthesis C-methylase UbiE